MAKRISLPLRKEEIAKLQIGEEVLLNGVIYTGRDAAHKRMIETLAAGGELPLDVNGQTIYYVGPCPAKDGQVIGSAGPTTSGRMDSYAPTLLDRGLLGMIGKGQRSPEVVEAIKRNGAVYFGAVGGAGALLSKKIVSMEVVAYADLGTEAIHKLEVKDFPVFVVINSRGDDLYVSGREAFRKATAEKSI